MKKIYLLFAGMAALMLASCSTDEQSTGGYVAGSTVTLNASLPNSGTRVTETADSTYGLITTWSSNDSLDVLVNTNTIVSMTKSTGNTFTAIPGDATVAAGFNAGKTIYGVNNKYNDKITTAVNGSQLKATVDFSGQDGTVGNLKKYDLMYGKGDPTGNITFNHKICVLRLDINSDSLKADSITIIRSMKLKYVATSGTPLFASKEVYNFGATCDSTITSADSIYLINPNIIVTDGKATVYIAVPHRQNLYGTFTMSLTGSKGGIYKSYDLTNAITLTNGRMLMSTVHPQAITGLHGSITSVKVGYYLFSDGTWGSLSSSSATPIGVVFSTITSGADQSHGWSHGYAMALKNASTSAAWGPNIVFPIPTGIMIRTVATEIADKDGYTHTQYINNTTYPAGYAAATTYQSVVAAPSSTSGWYLPSIGQWFDICVNLGKLSPTVYTDKSTSLGWAGQVSTCVTNLNAYLTPLTSGTYDTFPQSTSSVEYPYWSSSEFDPYSTDFIVFGTNSEVRLIYYYKQRLYRARSVIAF